MLVEQRRGQRHSLIGEEQSLAAVHVCWAEARDESNKGCKLQKMVTAFQMSVFGASCLSEEKNMCTTGTKSLREQLAAMYMLEVRTT